MEEPLLSSDTHSRNVSLISIPPFVKTRETKMNNVYQGGGNFINNSISTSRYNCCNFIPKTVFMQFRRLANVYFLIMSVLMWVGTYYPDLFTSPLSPGSTVGPLLVIVFLTCIKEGLEDLKRHRSDRSTNGRPQQVIHPKTSLDLSLPLDDEEGEYVTVPSTSNVPWEKIRVGQYIIVHDKEQIPADVVVLCSSNGDGCFIETSNIDGETNLKIREVPLRVLDLVEDEREKRKQRKQNGMNGMNSSNSSNSSNSNRDRSRTSSISGRTKVAAAEQECIDILRETSGTIEFEPPNRSIHTFVGTLKIKNTSEVSIYIYK